MLYKIKATGLPNIFCNFFLGFLVISSRFLKRILLTNFGTSLSQVKKGVSW